MSRSRPLIDAPPIAVDIGDDEPITLAEACRLFFGGRIKPSALRTEAARGNLDIMQIARKDFVTRAAIEEMKQRCLKSGNRQGSGSEQRSGPTAAPDHHGSSRMAGAVSAQAAARALLLKLNGSSQPTSQKNTKRQAEVVRLKRQ